MTAELQSFKECNKVESTKCATSGAQTEALNLLHNGSFNERRVTGKDIPSSLNTDSLYSNSVFSVGAKGSAKSDSAVGACKIDKPKCESEKNWKPDSERTTPGARAWDRQAESQRQKALDRNSNGNYTIKPGDSLDDISRRYLRGETGKNPSSKDVAAATKRIYEANPQLGCNPNLIRPGMELKLPRNEKPSLKTAPSNENTFDITNTKRGGNERAERSNERRQRTDNPNTPKTTEQQLDEMKRCLENMKRILEDMQKGQKSEQAGRGTDSPTKPPVQEKFFVPEARTQKNESNRNSDEEVRELLRRAPKEDLNPQWQLISEDMMGVQKH